MKTHKLLLCGTTRNLIAAVVATLILAASALAHDSETILYNFTGSGSGALAGEHFVFDSAGNLYGTTEVGGNNSNICAAYTGDVGCGVVFKLTPTKDGPWTETVLYTFTGGADGAVPIGGVVLDSAGNLYGTTHFGGDETSPNCLGSSGAGHPPGCGVVYKLTPAESGPWTQTVLYTFTAGSDGAFPWAGVILDSSGNVYGTTVTGGHAFSCNAGGGGCGVVFKLTPTDKGPWTESILHAFTGHADGNQLLGGLTFDAGGNLYGVTYEGGDTSVSCFGPNYPGCGTVFQLTPNSSGPWTETVLHRFTGGTDGATPLFNVILDSSGNVYGTTIYGGDLTARNCPGGYGNDSPAGCGVVFELTQGTWEETVLYAFAGGSAGQVGLSQLVLDSAGNLYGTTADGGDFAPQECQSTYSFFSGCGVVFKLTRADTAPWAETVLFAFDGADGGNAESNLAFDSSGNLYGMTYYGGSAACTCGLVFKLSQ